MKLRRQLFLPKLFYLLIISASFLYSHLIDSAEAAGIKSVQRGTVTFTSGANRMPVISPAFQPVDRTKTIVWGGVVHGGGRVNSANPNASRIAFELESDTVLALERLGSPTSTPVVEWQAVELVSGVFVQRNVQSLTTTQTTVNVPLPTTVDINKSFVLVSVAPNMTGQANDERWTIRAQLTGSNNLELFRADSGIAVDVYWQVVEMQGASVQRGLTTFPSTANATSATIPTSVDPLKSFLIMSFAGGSGINGIETRYMVRGAINTTGNAITFNRAGSGNAVNLAWEIVAMNDGSAVQSGSRSTAAGSDTLLDQGIADVDLSRSFVYLSVQGGASGATNSLDDVSWTGALTSQTNLRLQRAVGGSQGTVNWQVVQFALPATNLAITAQPGNAAAGAAIPGPLTVAVQDSLGNVVTSSTASITVVVGNNPTGSTLSGTLTRNAVSGVASFNDLSLDKVGNGYTLTVSSVGLTGTTSAPFNISPGAAAKLAFTTQPGNANAGSNIPGPPTVTVQDNFGNTVTSSTAAITMALGNNPGGGALSGTTTKNAVGGVASFSDLTINQPGSGYTLAASSTSLTGATSTGFDITAPDLVVTSVSDPPATAVAGGSFSVIDTTDNNGTGPAGASTTSYRLSTDAIITTSDPLLIGGRSVPGLAAGSNSSGNTTVTIPANLASGTYFLGACADNANTVAESNETNNCLASATTVTVFIQPTITSLSPTAGSAGTIVTITGSNFGAAQGTSTVTFNGTAAAPASWSANSIVVPVPAAATSGPVVVTVDGVASNGAAFTVKPPIGYIYDALGRLRAVMDPSSDTAVYNYEL
jgi:hypothetical protein